MEWAKHISLSLTHEQELYNFNEQYLVDFDFETNSYGVDSSFYYDRNTRCVVIAPYEDSGVVKTYYINASVDGGNNNYQMYDTLELSIVTMFPDESRKEYTGTGEAFYGVEYYTRDGYLDIDLGPKPLEAFEIKANVLVNTNCIVSVPPSGATIFIGVTPSVGEQEAFGSGDTYAKSIVGAFASVSQVYDVQQLA